MRTLKKLSLIISLALGMQFIAQAYVAQTHYNWAPHQTVYVHVPVPVLNHLTYEIHCILTFSQEIRHQNDKVARWLHRQAVDSINTWLSIDLSSILKIIDNPELTTEAKITIFSEQMEDEKRIQEKRAQEIAQQNQRMVKGLSICAGILGIAILGPLAYNIIKTQFLPERLIS